VRHRDGLLEVQEKLNGATLTLVRSALNFHQPLTPANATDPRVQKQKVVRRYEEMLRKELVSLLSQVDVKRVDYARGM
jgi:hypothetical protein